MSIQYLQYTAKDTEFYISKNYDEKSLMNIADKIKVAKKELEEMEMLIYKQFNKLQQIVERKEIIVHRQKTWKGKVNITVYVNVNRVLENEVIHAYMLHVSHKQFNGNERKHAFEYANTLKEKYHVVITKLGF